MGLAKKTPKSSAGAKGPRNAKAAKKPVVTLLGGHHQAPSLKVVEAKSKSTSKKAIAGIAQPPLTDEQVGIIPGLPTEAEIEQQAGELSPADKKTFATIRQLLAEHLGSYAAARAWLTTPGGGFDGSPLEAIRSGLAERVLKLLKAQWSRSSSYA